MTQWCLYGQHDTGSIISYEKLITSWHHSSRSLQSSLLSVMKADPSATTTTHTTSSMSAVNSQPNCQQPNTKYPVTVYNWHCTISLLSILFSFFFIQPTHSLFQSHSRWRLWIILIIKLLIIILSPPSDYFCTSDSIFLSTDTVHIANFYDIMIWYWRRNTDDSKYELR